MKALTYRALTICLDFLVIYLMTHKVEVAPGFIIVGNICTTDGLKPLTFRRRLRPFAPVPRWAGTRRSRSAHAITAGSTPPVTLAEVGEVLSDEHVQLGAATGRREKLAFPLVGGEPLSDLVQAVL